MWFKDLVKIEEQENRYIELNKDINFHGDRGTKVLIEEADGVIVRKQRRLKHYLILICRTNSKKELQIFYRRAEFRKRSAKDIFEKYVQCHMQQHW